MSNISDYTKPQYIIEIKSTNKYDAIVELADVLKNSPVCSDLNALIESLKEREDIMSTGIGFGLAIPHAKIPEVSDIAFAIGVSKDGIEFDSMDGEPVNVLIMVVAGENQHKEYLTLLSSIMSLIKNESIKNSIVEFSSAEGIYEILKSSDK